MRTPSRRAIGSIPMVTLACCSPAEMSASIWRSPAGHEKPDRPRSSPMDQATSRRKFLQYLASSPLAAAGGWSALAGEGPVAPNRLPDPIIWAPLKTEELIKAPKDAINVFDFEPVCRVNVPPAHFGYMASGIDDEVTLRANREGFLKFQLRPRRLVDVSKVDMSTNILGVKYDTPIVIAPVGGHRMFHPEGEIATAKGAKAGNH